MRRISLIAFGLSLLILGGSCKREDETPIVKETARDYWTAIFRGQTRQSYEMLSSESQAMIVYSDYARNVGLYPSQLTEVQEYWMAYYPLTDIEVHSAVIDRKTKTAVVSLTLTQPDPKWFPDEAVAEAEEMGLEGPKLARYVLKKQAEALSQGRVPTIKIAENTKLVKEEDEWKIVYTRL